jgi:hypothetical protein
MHKAITIGAVATLCLGLLPPASAQGKRPVGNVQATVTFTGRGTVDQTRRIWVFLFDTPAPGPGTQPLAVQAITKSGGVAAFKGLTISPVYVLVAYDEDAAYDGKSATPPIGAPIGMYSTDGKEPSPVEPGPAVKVRVSFGDSRRMGK